MSQKAYGQITLIDITDIGELTVVPESNLASIVVYDINSSSFNPSWTTEHPLKLTPAIKYAGTDLTTNEEGVSIDWYEVHETGSESKLSSSSDLGIQINNGILTISKNLLNITSKKTVCFRCKCSYKVPNIDYTATAAGDISFALVTMGETLHQVRIIAPQIIKYNKTTSTFENNLPIQAQRTNVTMSSSSSSNYPWQYKIDDAQSWSNITKDDIEEDSIDTASITITQTWLDTKLTNGSRLTIKVNTVWAENTSKLVSDELSIFKVSDGAAGTNLINLHLSNDNQSVPFFTQDGTTDYNWALAYTSCDLLRGGDSILTQGFYDIKVTAEGVNYTKKVFNADKNQYQDATQDTDKVTEVTDRFYATKFTSDAKQGVITFTTEVTELGTANDYSALSISKKFTITGLQRGADGTSPTLKTIESPQGGVLKRIIISANGEDSISYIPTQTTVQYYVQTGNQISSPDVDWCLYLNAPSPDVHTTTEDYYPLTDHTREDEVEKVTINWMDATIQDAIEDLKQVYVVAHAAGSNAVLAVYPITILQDGEKGDQGADGAEGLTFIFPNQADQISCDEDGLVVGEQIISLPFSIYQGGSPYNDYDASTQGYTDITNTKTKYRLNLDTSVNIKDEIECPPAIYPGTIGQATCYDNKNWNKSSTHSISYTLQTGTVNERNEWTWTNVNDASKFVCKLTKNCQGAASVLLVLNTPNGGIFHNGEGLETIEARFYKGGDEQEFDNWTCSWYELTSQAGSTNATWKEIDNITDATKELYISTKDGKVSILTIRPSAVQSLKSFKCECKYGPEGAKKTLVQYQDILDYNDPLQISMYSTAGLQFVNKQGIGAVYTRVFRNQEEIDALPTENFVTILPATETATTGDSCFYIDSVEKEVSYRVYNGKGWEKKEDYGDNYLYHYSYDYRDRNGNPYQDETHLPQDGKVIYISASDIDQKLTINVEVTKIKKTTSTTNS